MVDSRGSVANIVGCVRGQTYVALESALENKLLSHIGFFVEIGSTKRRSGVVGRWWLGFNWLAGTRTRVPRSSQSRDVDGWRRVCDEKSRANHKVHFDSRPASWR
jgi:hypothetical protein